MRIYLDERNRHQQSNHRWNYRCVLCEAKFSPNVRWKTAARSQICNFLRGCKRTVSKSVDTGFICIRAQKPSSSSSSLRKGIPNIYTVLQKKKVHAPEMRPIYCDGYGPIEKPYVRRLSRSKRVAEI